MVREKGPKDKRRTARSLPAAGRLRYALFGAAQGKQDDSVEAERRLGRVAMGGVNPAPTTARQTQREKPQTSQRSRSAALQKRNSEKIPTLKKRAWGTRKTTAAGLKADATSAAHLRSNPGMAA